MTEGAIHRSLFVVGVLIQLAGWFVDRVVTPDSLLTSVVAPHFADARLGFDALYRGHQLQSSDEGFDEMVALLVAELPELSSQKIDALRAGVTALDVPDPATGTRSGPVVRIAAFYQGISVAAPVKISGAEEKLKERFFDSPVWWLGTIVFFIGLVLMIVNEMIADRE